MVDFDDIVDGLVLEEPERLELGQVPDPDLAVMLDRVRVQLLEMGEMLNPTSDKARALHEERGAILIEIDLRKERKNLEGQ